MIFKAQMVSYQTKGLTIMAMGMVVFLVLLLAFIYPPLQSYAAPIIMVVMVGIMITVWWQKGDSAAYNLEKEFKVYEDRFEIDNFIFPFTELSKIDFHFKGFKGMQPNATDVYASENTWQTAIQSEYGLNNKITFYYKSQTFQYNFYLQDRNHFLLFVKMLQTLYENGIVFTEQNNYGKTFMMGNIKHP